MREAASTSAGVAAGLDIDAFARFDDAVRDGTLRPVGHTSGFNAKQKRELPAFLAPATLPPAVTETITSSISPVETRTRSASATWSAAVFEPGEGGVERLQLEQSQLDGGLGLHRGAIRIAPSRRIVSPFSIGFSTM